MLTTLLLARLSTPLWLGPCLTAESLAPDSGQGPAAVFEAVYGHCQGATTFRVVQLWIGDEVTPAVDRVNLGYEDGMFSLEGGGTCAPLDPVVLHSAMGSLDCAASSVTLAGTQATVRWAVEFDTVEFAGVHGLFFDAKGGVGDPEPRLGWTQMGTFVVAPEAADTGGSTSGDATSGSSSGGEGESTTSTSTGSDTAIDTDAATDTDGTIPGGGVTQRGNLGDCACRVRGEHAVAWWLAAVFVLLRRRDHSHAGSISPRSST